MLINGSEAMRKFSVQNVWFLPMLNGMLAGKVRPAPNLDKPREDLDEADGRKLGIYIISSLAVNAQPAAGVHEWINKYGAASEASANE